MASRQLIFRDHATQRIMQRGIRPKDIRFVLEYGEVIEDYSTDFPYPSRLVLAWINKKPIHVVAADHPALAVTFVITVYEPDPTQWEPGFKHRRTT